MKRSDDLIGRNGPDDSTWIAGKDTAIGYVSGDNATGSNESILPNRYTRQQNAATSDAGRAQYPWSLTIEALSWPSVTDRSIIHSDNARPQEHLVFYQDAPRQITCALDRYEITDSNISFDVNVGSDQAIFTDDRTVPDHDKISDPCAFADLRVVKNQAMLLIGR